MRVPRCPGVATVVKKNSVGSALPRATVQSKHSRNTVTAQSQCTATAQSLDNHWTVTAQAPVNEIAALEMKKKMEAANPGKVCSILACRKALSQCRNFEGRAYSYLSSNFDVLQKFAEDAAASAEGNIH